MTETHVQSSRRLGACPKPLGKDHYAAIYRQKLEDQAYWLSATAAAKVDSIERLIRRNAIASESILELGSGTGAVICELQRRGLGKDLTAVDYSEEAIRYLLDHSRGIRCRAADITNPSFHLDETYDVVILSHVLEHLEQPLEFLNSIRQNIMFRALIAEVPLEDLVAARIKNVFTGYRRNNPAGHVQFFTYKTFRSLVTSAGFRIADQRIYVPRLTNALVDFVSKDSGPARRCVRRLTQVYLPKFFGPVWQRLYYSHAAVLCYPA